MNELLNGSLDSGPVVLRGYVHPGCQDEWDKYGYDPDRAIPCLDCAVHLGAALEIESLQQEVEKLRAQVEEARGIVHSWNEADDPFTIYQRLGTALP